MLHEFHFLLCERCTVAVCCVSWRHVFISWGSHFPFYECESPRGMKESFVCLIYDPTVSCLEGKLTNFFNN